MLQCDPGSHGQQRIWIDLMVATGWHQGCCLFSFHVHSTVHFRFLSPHASEDKGQRGTGLLSCQARRLSCSQSVVCRRLTGCRARRASCVVRLTGCHARRASCAAGSQAVVLTERRVVRLTGCHAHRASCAAGSQAVVLAEGRVLSQAHKLSCSQSVVLSGSQAVVLAERRVVRLTGCRAYRASCCQAHKLSCSQSVVCCQAHRLPCSQKVVLSGLQAVVLSGSQAAMDDPAGPAWVPGLLKLYRFLSALLISKNFHNFLLTSLNLLVYLCKRASCCQQSIMNDLT